MKRILLTVAVAVAVITGVVRQVQAQDSTPTPTQGAAPDTITIKLGFEYVRQGNVGLITLTGPNLLGAQAAALGKTYPFFPISTGFACLLSVPLDAKIKDYPISVTITRADGSTVSWDGTFKVQSGGYIQEDPFSLPGNKVYLLRDDIQESENLRLLTTYSVITPDRYWEGVFTPPVNGPLSSPFGSTRLFNGIATKRHTGYDFKVPAGTPILASASGRVVLSRPMDIHGNNVVIDHGWGVFSEYAHMSVRYVVPGQFVLQGDVIGLSGTTGRSTGPHVHWEISVNGVWVNPLQFMQVRIPS